MALREKLLNTARFTVETRSVASSCFSVPVGHEVDELYLKIKGIGATIVDEPKFYPQHGESYYALFFKDLEGIKYEIVYEEGR